LELNLNNFLLKIDQVDCMKGVSRYALILGIILIVAVFLVSTSFFGGISGLFAAFSPEQPETDITDTGTPDGRETNPGPIVGPPVITEPGPGPDSDPGSDSGPETNPETQPDDDIDEPQTPPRTGGGSSSGGGSRPCVPVWEPTAWSSCAPDGSQSRTLIDVRCMTDSRVETAACNYTAPDTDACNGVCIIPKSLSLDSNVDQGFTVYVTVNTSDEVMAASFKLPYDPAVLNVTSVFEGDYLKKDGYTATFPVINIKESASLIDFGNTRFNTTTGVSGEGILAEINFEILSAGSINLDLTEVKVVDPTIQPISMPVSNSIVSIV
jgi:hypothetical protein